MTTKTAASFFLSSSCSSVGTYNDDLAAQDLLDRSVSGIEDTSLVIEMQRSPK